MNLCAETGEAALLEAKLRAEIEALKGQAAKDQQGRQELQRQLAEQTQKVTRLEGEADKLRGTIEKRDAQYKAKLAEIKKDLETQREEAGSGYRPITVSTLREEIPRPHEAVHQLPLAGGVRGLAGLPQRRWSVGQRVGQEGV